jgi:hypothetical protein
VVVLVLLLLVLLGGRGRRVEGRRGVVAAAVRAPVVPAQGSSIAALLLLVLLLLLQRRAPERAKVDAAQPVGRGPGGHGRWVVVVLRARRRQSPRADDGEEGEGREPLSEAHVRRFPARPRR